jgi:hypothetical protein
MKIEGNINFPEELPGRKEEREDDEPAAPADEDDENEDYVQELYDQ